MDRLVSNVNTCNNLSMQYHENYWVNNCSDRLWHGWRKEDVSGGHAQLKGDKEEGVGGGGGWKSINCYNSLTPGSDDLKAADREGLSHTLTISNTQAQLQTRPINGSKQGRPRLLYILHKNAFYVRGQMVKFSLYYK